MFVSLCGLLLRICCIAVCHSFYYSYFLYIYMYEG